MKDKKLVEELTKLGEVVEVSGVKEKVLECAKCGRKATQEEADNKFGCYYSIDKETNKLALKLVCPPCMLKFPNPEE